MVYGYELNKNLKNVNLGDYVQSIAANQFLQVYDANAYFSRDDMTKLREGDSAILNGWYRLKENSHVIKNVNILPISVHIHNRREVAEISSVIRSWGGWLGAGIYLRLSF